MKMIDIHCHILPNVDDGPDKAEESIRILKEMQKQGIRHVIVTPHYREDMFEPSMKRVLDSYRSLRQAAREMDISLHLGCEYYRNEKMVEDLEKKRRPTMAGSHYVLVEFSTDDMFVTIRNYIYELVTHGYRPIVAHVERYRSCQQAEKIQELKELGALIQINAGSVLGEDGWKLKRFCFVLMKADVVDFIASDTHNTKSRRQNLQKCASYVEKKMGRRYTARIFVENPLNILKNR